MPRKNLRLDRRVFTCEVCNSKEPCMLVATTIDMPFDCPYGGLDAKWEELINLGKEIDEEVEAYA